MYFILHHISSIVRLEFSKWAPLHFFPFYLLGWVGCLHGIANVPLLIVGCHAVGIALIPKELTVVVVVVMSLAIRADIMEIRFSANLSRQSNSQCYFFHLRGQNCHFYKVNIVELY
ncbi:hypothetical protein I7I53_00478 [Histoplasma capsulatum var. duboisii H88]|uniref:Uncharacterized protein n=1 Tax=Ajellomyces capsulatus (strain H88) TaxID=544711 RepID=A0A8A1LJX0_AJEC8|nr:hypothetical protein I7I53_00478 [Histoplasma capsulatum var. duboisii H88]